MEKSELTNIDQNHKRLRLYAGIAAWAAGIVILPFLLSSEIHPLWRLIVFVPFWLGALGTLQYHDGIWVLHAARGTRADVDNTKPIEDAEAQREIFRRSLWIHLYAILVAGVLTGIIYFLPA